MCFEWEIKIIGKLEFFRVILVIFYILSWICEKGIKVIFFWYRDKENR